MFQRGIAVHEVSAVIQFGKTIEEYPNAYPYPSRLVLGSPDWRVLHVVIAENRPDNQTIVITVYEPSVERWEMNFRRRRGK